MTSELKPCPFCGSEAEVVESDYGMYLTGYAVYCRKCCSKMGVTGRLGEAYEWTPIFNTEAAAIDAWNTRAERTCTNELQPDKNRRNFFKCSACGCTVTDCEDYCVNVYTSDGAVGWSYCPHCGAKVMTQ